MNFYKFSFLNIFSLLVCFSFAQGGTYVPLGSQTYHYLDRLEIKSGLVDGFHTASKPYDRAMVMNFVGRIDTGDIEIDLTKLDEKNLLYLYKDNFEFDYDEKIDRRDRAVLGFMYKHPAHFMSVETPHFKAAVNPAVYVRGGQDFAEKDFKFFNSKGFEARGQIDKWVGFYALFLSEQGRFPNYVNQYVKQHKVVPHAGYWKEYGNGGFDYFLAKGYVTFSPSKHINFQFGYDNNFIGDGIRSMFLSDFSNNYMFFKINTNVWKINYQNIFAELTKYYGHGADGLLDKKYVAMHHLSFNITKWLNLGVFESVVFSRANHFELQYLNPLIFYRSIEQALGSPDNAFIGFDFKMNFAKHLQFYGQLLLDELNFSKEFSVPGKSKFYGLTHPNKWWANKFSAQFGLKYIDMFGVDHLDFQFEANVSRPYTYSHTDTITSYTHYNQPLAHPLGANFTELIAEIKYQPLQQLFISSRFIYNKYGENTSTENWGADPLQPYGNFVNEFGNYIGQGVQAKQFYVDVLATYEPWHNIFVDLNYIYRKKNSQNDALDMKTHFVNLGLRWSIPYRRYEF
ncbi:MAG: hypothetical protein H6553_06120 [Chitinophagales bacterium]|nr:hypothetical protein [Chitinophagales bacterium]